MSDAPGRAPTTSLIADAMAQMARLVETEVRLVRTELSEKLTQAVTAVATIVAAAILLVVALFLILIGFVDLLVYLFGLQPFAAYFIIGGVFVMVGAVAIAIAIHRLKPAVLAPKRSFDQLGKDAQVIKERVS